MQAILLRRAESPALPRGLLLAIAAGRTLIGAGAIVAAGPALRLLGFPDTDPSGRALARLAAERDIALGLLVLAMRDQPALLRASASASAAVDAGDALSLSLAAARQVEIRPAGILGAVAGGAAAIAGAWAVSRL